MDYEKSLTRDSNDERVPKTSLCDRFDERMRALWLMLMNQEDGLSRKITVNISIIVSRRLPHVPAMAVAPNQRPVIDMFQLAKP